MIITLKNYELVNLYMAIKEIMSLKLPVKMGWNFSKNSLIIERILESLQDEEIRLVNEYGEKDDDGNLKHINNNQVIIKDENKDIYNEEYKELMDCENELELLTIKLNDLIYTKNTQGEQIEREIEPRLLHSLSAILDDSE